MNLKVGQPVVFKSESMRNKLGYTLKKGRVVWQDKSGLFLVNADDADRNHLISKDLIENDG